MKKQTLFGILGTLILGALGSGLWELIKPGFSYLNATTLTIISLGLDSLVNDIYMRVGRGNQLSTLIKASVLMIISLPTFIYSTILLIQSAKNPTPNFHKKLLGLFLMFFAAYLLLGQMRHLYVASTRSYFNYLVRVASPYMTTEQLLIMDSKLALVKNRQDYEKLVTDLKLLLQSKKITIDEE